MTLTPTSQAWLEGVKAFEAHAFRNSNPYAKLPAGDLSAKLAASWFSGWDDAAVIVSISPKHKMEAA